MDADATGNGFCQCNLMGKYIKAPAKIRTPAANNKSSMILKGVCMEERRIETQPWNGK